MVHQYDHRERQSEFAKKYHNAMEQNPNPVNQANIQNELLGNNHITIHPSKNNLALNPNPKFLEEFEKRQIKKREQETKRENFEQFNEKGEKYASIWNNKDFRKVHDPLGNLNFNKN